MARDVVVAGLVVVVVVVAAVVAVVVTVLVVPAAPVQAATNTARKKKERRIRSPMLRRRVNQAESAMSAGQIERTCQALSRVPRTGRWGTADRG